MAKRPKQSGKEPTHRPSSKSGKGSKNIKPIESRSVVDHLMTQVESEIREIASKHLSHERSDHVLQTTALVNEAYLRLIKQRNIRKSDRKHFLATVTTVIRRVLVDQARQRNSAKRGSNARLVRLDEADHLLVKDIADFLSTEEALNRLAALDARAAKVVELRYIGGLTVEETAEVLGVSVRVVYEDWAMARAWLRKELSREG